MNKKKVDICICTYRRPPLLAKTLESLDNQEYNDQEIFFKIIIIDNDAEASARDTVENFSKKTSHEVIYDIEKTKGISSARNRALSHAKSELIAFLDDDEIASKNWLQTLITTLEKYNADVVFGPVTGILPPDSPKWAKQHPSFNRPRNPTGHVVKNGGAGNVIFKNPKLEQPTQLFDQYYSLTGGEDTEYFSRLSSSGKKMVWCDTAEVYEYVPCSRTTIRWVTQRGFRSGQTYYRIFIKNLPPSKKTFWLLKKITHSLFAISALPLLALCAPSIGVNVLTRLSASLGQISAPLGEKFTFSEYSRNPESKPN